MARTTTESKPKIRDTRTKTAETKVLDPGAAFKDAISKGLKNPEDYMYVYNSKGLKFINVRGIFEDPTDLKHFQCENGTCWNDNSTFPMPADMIHAITNGMSSGELRFLTGTFSDTLADNAQDNKTIVGKAQPKRQ